LTLTATWDGIPTGGSAPVSGTFVISDQLAPQAATATVTIAGSTSTPTAPDPPVNDPPPGPAPPVAGSSPSPITVSVTTNHPTYRIGHPVRMTLTLHNDGRSPVDLEPDSSRDGITVLEGSTEIWHRARTVARRLKPGHSIKVTAVWDGQTGRSDATIAPGTYTVEAVEGGQSGSTTVRIVA
jgi:hypothetical protein